LRQSRNIGALRETHREVDQEQNSPVAQSQAPEQNVRQSAPVRSWSHRGGMVPQQESANTWIRQDNDIRMAQSSRQGAERSGEGAQQPGREQGNANLQQARAAAEEARKHQAAQKQREAERAPERGGPER
jgi:hypothetical protein